MRLMSNLFEVYMRFILGLLFLLCLYSCEFTEHMSARVDFARGDYKQAVTKWQNIVKKNPENYQAKFWLGKCNYSMGNWQNAFYIWKSIPDNNNMNWDFDREKSKLQKDAIELDKLIDLYANKKNKKEYIDVYNKLLEFVTGNRDQFLLARAYYLLGIMQEELGRKALSQESFQKVMDSRYVPLIQILMMKKAEKDPGIYKELIETYPSSPFIEDWYLNFVKHAIKKQDFETIDSLKNNLKNDSVKQDIIFTLAKSYLGVETLRGIYLFKEYLKRWPEGKHIKSVIKFCAENLGYFNNKEKFTLGKSSYRNEMFVSAVNILRSVTGFAPESQYLIADSFRQLGDSGTAKQIFYNIIRNNPKDIYSGKSMLSMAITAREKDNYGEAIRLLNTVLEKHPDLSSPALWELGTNYRYVKNTAKELESYTRLYKTDPDHENMTSALWRHFWILYKSRDYDKAVNIADQFISRYKKSEIYPRFLYWRGRIAEFKKDISSAKSYYASATRESLGNFYTYQSHKRLKELKDENSSYIRTSMDKLRKIRASSLSLPNISGQIAFYLKNSSNKIFYSLPMEIQELIYLHQYDKALEFTYQNKGKKEYDFLRACIYLNWKKYHTAIKTAEKHEDEIEFLPLIYPVAYEEYIKPECSAVNLDPALAMAMIWQESKYAPFAISSVGALGLMQLMPGTAQGIANKLGIADYNQYKLYEPKINIKFGVYYLNFTMKAFNNNAVAAVGSYNAGPGALRAWMAKYSDLDEDEFIETIPYLETRNYVRNILTIYNIYKIFLEK